MFRKSYIDISSGQIHAQENGPGGGPPLLCLHATAYSGQTFHPLLRAFNGTRRLLALDTPGYGASDRPDSISTMQRHGQALAEAADRIGGPVDVLGYHTGAFLACEMAIQFPVLVRRLVLIGVPFYEGAARQERRRTLGGAMTLTEDLSQFEERWSFFISNRPAGMSLPRGFANFVDELRAWPHGWWAHDAAFDYAAEERLPLVPQPTLILNPDNHLAPPSRAAAAIMPDARLVELPHLGHAIFEVAADELRDRMQDFLSAET